MFSVSCLLSFVAYLTLIYNYKLLITKEHIPKVYIQIWNVISIIVEYRFKYRHIRKLNV